MCGRGGALLSGIQINDLNPSFPEEGFLSLRQKHHPRASSRGSEINHPLPEHARQAPPMSFFDLVFRGDGPPELGEGACVDTRQ